ncbi:MAG TPA: hypothetical protein VIO84_07700 [Candidatus Dormibacteraeota bacterium]|jgi:hypothetical protein
MRTLTAMVIGGTLVYFLDPSSGARRRARARRGLESMLNMGARGAREVGRPEVADAIGKVQRVTRTEREPESPVILPSAAKA